MAEHIRNEMLNRDPTTREQSQALHWIIILKLFMQKTIVKWLLFQSCHSAKNKWFERGFFCEQFIWTIESIAEYKFLHASWIKKENKIVDSEINWLTVSIKIRSTGDEKSLSIFIEEFIIACYCFVHFEGNEGVLASNLYLKILTFSTKNLNK